MTDTTSVQMITCNDCGKQLPETNMTMHRLMACAGYARASSARNEEEKEDNDVVDLTSPANRKREDPPPSTPPPSSRRRGRLKRDDDYSSDVEPMDVDSNDDDEVEIIETSDNSHDDSVEVVDQDVVEILDDEWACKKCTLLNDKDVTVCVMCQTRKEGATDRPQQQTDSDGVRPPDPTRRERLIGGDWDSPPRGMPPGGSPLTAMGGGALLGGIVGGAAAYMRGQSMSRGALDGSVAGAVSGVFLNEFMQSPDRPSAASRRRHTVRNDSSDWDNLTGARSSTVTGQPSYPSFGSSANQRATRQPRASFRVSEITNPDGSRRFMVSESNRHGSMRYSRHSHSAISDPVMQALLASRVGGLGAAGTGGVDGMSYDQLLSAFGDGTENLGASIQLISSLPTAKVKTKADGTIDLPEGARQCAVCLEDFEQGQIRKTLQCLHGFHATCVDKWLQTNACCPVCKFRVEENGRPSR
ncbi:protein ligase Arkadia [Seminavis robusta]|uniref:RING-type E3 ubiquitin transferase n=1 Tax=Seminavis robusta TaxID=568900 RepID=A0A9N8EWA5_9STRA|nr:protein ligase Arkadia [Seminavis robusta]|eukprot:Sro2009_g310720.1 protein ligase Arkadia (471) ;mRNA; r:9561-10973